MADASGGPARCAACVALAYAASGAGRAVEREPIAAAAPASLSLGVAGAVNEHASVAADGPRVVVALGSDAVGHGHGRLRRRQPRRRRTFDAPVRVNDVPATHACPASRRRAWRSGTACRSSGSRARPGRPCFRARRCAPGERASRPAPRSTPRPHRARADGRRRRRPRGAVHVAWLDGRGDAPPTPAASRPEAGMREQGACGRTCTRPCGAPTARTTRRASRRTCASAARRRSPRAPDGGRLRGLAAHLSRPTCATSPWRGRPTAAAPSRSRCA